LVFFVQYAHPNTVESLNTKSYNYAKLAIKVYATVLAGGVENRPTPEYVGPKRMPIHALPVHCFAQALPKYNLIFVCKCMNYTLCVPHFCVKVKR